MCAGDGGNERGGEDVASFGTGLLGNTKLIDDGRQSGDGSKDDDKGDDDSEG